MNTEKLDRFIDLLPECGIPCADFAISHEGKLVYRHMTGHADNERTRLLSERDLYYVFSVSKVTTCIAAMRLVEEGIIGLDDPVSKFLPSYANLTVRQKDGSVKPAENVMTVRHLFTMTGGLDYDINSAPIIRARNIPGANTVSILSALPEAPLQFEPGTRYKYSLCHDVLAAVVEVASGERFSEYVRKNITEPLGMLDTTYHPSEAQKSRLVDMRRFVHGLMRSEPVDAEKHISHYVINDAYDSGGAGLCTSVNDQMKLLTVLANGGSTPDGYRILSQKSIEMMGEGGLPDSARPDFQPSRLYGYSWGLCGRAHVNPIHSCARSSVGEFGWDGAAGAFALVDPTKRVAMYFGMEVLGCNYSYHHVFPKLRDMGFELLGY